MEKTYEAVEREIQKACGLAKLSATQKLCGSVYAKLAAASVLLESECASNTKRDGEPPREREYERDTEFPCAFAEALPSRERGLARVPRLI